MDGQPCAARPAGSLSLVIPAYNEEAVIRRAVAEADEALAGLGGPYEILVVDDGSRDGTAEAVAAEAAVRPHVRLVRHPGNRGYGAALRTGFAAARFDRVAFTDADCQFNLEDLGTLAALTAERPIAVGWRRQRQDPWGRRLISRGYNLLVRTLLGTRVRDCDCALKVFRRDALARLLPETDGFFVNAEMLARARQLGYGVAEVAVRHRPRLGGSSKVSLTEVPRTLAALLPFWWTRVLFPGPSATAPGDGRRRRFDLGLAVVVLAAALLFFGRLRCPLVEPDEARYAEIPRQMLAQGTWLAPADGRAPPLLHWLIAGAYALFGVHDWAARLVPCAAAFLTVLAAYRWGRRAVGPRAAFAGALILCLSAGFVYRGRMLTGDSLLALWTVTSWKTAHATAQDGGRRRARWLCSAAACGGGVLAAGPVALVLTAAPVLAWETLDRRAARPRARGWLVYLAVVAAVAAPWYVPALCGTAVVGVAAGDFAAGGPSVGVGLAGLIAGMLPWSLLFPALVKLLGRRSAVAGARRPPGLGFFLLAAAGCLAVAVVTGPGRAGGLLPAAPPLALALGCYLDRRLPVGDLAHLRTLHSRRLGAWAHRGTQMVLAVVAAVALIALIAKPPHADGACPVAALAGGGLLLTWRRGPGRRVAVAGAVCAATTFAAVLAGVHLVLPAYARQLSLREQVAAHAGPAADPTVPVVCYPRRWDAVCFYLRRDDVRAYPADRREQFIAALRERPGTLVFVQSDLYLADLRRSLPPGLEFVPHGPDGIVTGGYVRRRIPVPDVLFASERWARGGGTP